MPGSHLQLLLAELPCADVGRIFFFLVLQISPTFLSAHNLFLGVVLMANNNTNFILAYFWLTIVKLISHLHTF